MSEQETRIHIRITADRKKTELGLKEVWDYRDLILLLSRKKFFLLYKQTILGPIWAFLTPLITSIIYTLVFGKIARIDTGNVPQLLFYLTGTALWNYVATCITENANAFIVNADLFSKVYFPRLVVPISNMIVCLWRLFLQFVPVILCLIWFIIRGEVQPHYLLWILLPLLLALLGVIGTDIGVICSSMTTKYRDLLMVIPFLVQVLMYLTPVIYPASQFLAGEWQKLLWINPLTAPMEAFRYILLGEGTVSAGGLIWSLLFAFGGFLLGVILFHRVEKTFVDTI